MGKVSCGESVIWGKCQMGKCNMKKVSHEESVIWGNCHMGKFSYGDSVLWKK